MYPRSDPNEDFKLQAGGYLGFFIQYRVLFNFTGFSGGHLTGMAGAAFDGFMCVQSCIQYQEVTTGGRGEDIHLDLLVTMRRMVKTTGGMLASAINGGSTTYRSSETVLCAVVYLRCPCLLAMERKYGNPDNKNEDAAAVLMAGTLIDARAIVRA